MIHPGVIKYVEQCQRIDSSGSQNLRNAMGGAKSIWNLIVVERLKMIRLQERGKVGIEWLSLDHHRRLSMNLKIISK